ncbi:hypothetical protein ASPZODRAFT_62938 [Penicilliopsis zonata CBS 506.65]|uniref:Major facilitator superfamily (MFS) profile domain-containing protein n=1 Tax=Penicilliopsis zonata CBS 506.65 TaxID=1073090 RepID=A0A1L9SLY6_9EURO|nr:hypothetical protein ASPZODRAFT_62938 [Penicilliopsis zonata CBS 506.65]OJJ48235.1 hypothetical protein ASPZODRAFT_62938 [Penicilliopsis zonata CBS 506.65]
MSVSANAQSEKGDVIVSTDLVTVDWDGPDDPENPVNWKPSRKAPTIVLISVMTFITPLSSSMFSPAEEEVMASFNTTSTMMGAFAVSVFVLGYAFGPILVAPASELYGRLPVYHTCNLLFFVWSVACAKASSMGMLIGMRFLAGIAGSCPITIGAGSIADTIPAERRGAVMAIWAMGPILGPVVGPVAGGFISEYKGWRWTFWILVILSGAFLVVSLIFMRETYPPVLLRKRAQKLEKKGRQNGDDREYRSALDTEMLTPGQQIKLAISRPFKLLFFSPIVLFLSTYCAVVYGILYLIFTTLAFVFEGIYGFSQGTVGLSFLGIGVGCAVGLAISGAGSDTLVTRLSHGGERKPEYRLPQMILGAVLLPIGMFWYGWSVHARVHWICPIIGTSFVGMGMMTIFMSVSMYLVDAYVIYAASATASNTILRSLGGALLPLAGGPMLNALGVAWSASLLGFISLAIIPGGVLLYKYGEQIRTNPRFQVKL